MNFFGWYFFCCICGLVCWLILPIVMGKDEGTWGLFNKKWWVIKAPILVLLVQGISWPVLFENLGARPLVFRENGEMVQFHALVSRWEFVRLSKEEFLTPLPSWQDLSVDLVTGDGLELTLRLVCRYSFSEFVDSTVCPLAPKVQKGEGDLVPVLSREFGELWAELGDKFVGAVLNANFRLYGFQVIGVQTRLNDMLRPVQTTRDQPAGCEEQSSTNATDEPAITNWSQVSPGG